VIRRAAAVALCALLLGGCGRVYDVAETKRALKQAGYSDVSVSLDTAGGLGFARVELSNDGGPRPERAAELVWDTLAVRFYTLSIVVDGEHAAFYTYDEAEQEFGPRDPSLNRRQIDEELVAGGLKLMLLLSAGALLSVGVVVGMAVAVVRATRRARRGSG
jgi:hypothetical protein